VFEDGFPEGFLDVADFTLLAIKTPVAFFHVIAFMAGITGLTDFSMNTGADMTAVATGVFMTVPQWVTGITVMQEDTGLEGFFVVTGLALSAVTPLVASLAVIFRMTPKTVARGFRSDTVR